MSKQKIDFLNELCDLLDKYDAEICADYGSRGCTMDIFLGSTNEEIIFMQDAINVHVLVGKIKSLQDN